MTRTAHGEQSTGIGTVYVALELSAREWWVTLSTGPSARRVRRRMAPGDVGAWQRAIATARAVLGLSAGAALVSCYEAGRDGFWPHRWLTARGVRNVVVDSSSIEVSRRARHAKTDRLDGEKLLRLLLRYAGGERDVWRVVHVPSVAAEDARHASRALTTLTRERTQYRNRIHSLLAMHGVSPVRLDAQFPARVVAARDWADAPLPPGVQARVLQQWRVLQAIEAERRAAREAERAAVGPTAAPPSAAARLAQQLAQVRGLAARSATILADELFSRDLRDRREVGALAGLVSAPYASGQTRRDQGLARSGLPAVRRIAVEVAWAWLRYQPTSALTQWYRQRFAGGSPGQRRLGIIALARRVLIALWRYLTQGVVPAGALLKA